MYVIQASICVGIHWSEISCEPVVTSETVETVAPNYGMQGELVDVVCPTGVGEGDVVNVSTLDGRTFDVALPAGVHEGDTFQVELLPDASMPAGLRAVAASMEAARAIAAEFFGDLGATCI